MIKRRKAKLDWYNIRYRRKDISERKKEEENVSSYWMTLRKLKKEALDHILWRTHFGRSYRPVIRWTTEYTNLHKEKRWYKMINMRQMKTRECSKQTE
jgi:hypothetical protein